MDRAQLRELAREMYRSGARYRGIERELGVPRSTLSTWLRDLRGSERRPPPQAVLSDARAATARDLRRSGALLREIAGELQVSVSCVHRWVRDLPVPPAARPGGDAAHTAAMRARQQQVGAAERERERGENVAAGRALVGALEDRDLLLLGVCAYWCEGSKSKPWHRREFLTFTNSDAGLVLLFDRWLDLVGHPREARSYRLSIHAGADLPAASAHWADVLAIEVGDLCPPQLKRQAVRTVRHNTGEAYVGCLVVQARQSRVLYQRLEGVWKGIVEALPAAGAVAQAPSRVVQGQDKGL